MLNGPTCVVSMVAKKNMVVEFDGVSARCSFSNVLSNLGEGAIGVNIEIFWLWTHILRTMERARHFVSKSIPRPSNELQLITTTLVSFV